jgi:hypothetical protein
MLILTKVCKICRHLFLWGKVKEGMKEKVSLEEDCCDGCAIEREVE